MDKYAGALGAGRVVAEHAGAEQRREKARGLPPLSGLHAASLKDFGQRLCFVTARCDIPVFVIAASSDAAALPATAAASRVAADLERRAAESEATQARHERKLALHLPTCTCAGLHLCLCLHPYGSYAEYWPPFLHAEFASLIAAQARRESNRRCTGCKRFACICCD